MPGIFISASRIPSISPFELSPSSPDLLTVLSVASRVQSDNTESESIATLPSHDNETISPSLCGSLSRFPLEVRNMIYNNVLIYHHWWISRPHRFLGPHPPIETKDSMHIQVIDAALLRTCKAIYHEAIRMLYGKNTFHFLKPSDIKDFAHLGLGNMPFGSYGAISKSASVVNNAPYGRLTMIRRLSLRLSSENNGDDIQKIWSFWSDFFYPPEQQDQLVGFPALERLSLDLSEWKLTSDDASSIRVCRFDFHILCPLNQLSLSLGVVSPVGILGGQEASMQVPCLTYTRFD